MMKKINEKMRINLCRSLACLVVGLLSAHCHAAATNHEQVEEGAEVVKTYPVGDDTYVTELSLDMKQVYDIYLSTAKPRRVKDVKYY